jgi:hypothetical protein
MVHYLDTIRVFLDEDTQVEYQRRLIMPYEEMCGPFEDVGYLWPKHEHVTSFQDANGEKYHVLEPLQKVLDGWLLYMEQNDSPFSFSLL